MLRQAFTRFLRRGVAVESAVPSVVPVATVAESLKEGPTPDAAP
jgi:hypothetical protein